MNLTDKVSYFDDFTRLLRNRCELLSDFRSYRLSQWSLQNKPYKPFTRLSLILGRIKHPKDYDIKPLGLDPTVKNVLVSVKTLGQSLSRDLQRPNNVGPVEDGLKTR